jgi:hypothetical protein
LGQDIRAAEGFGVDLYGLVRPCEGDIDVGMRSHKEVAKRFGETLGCSRSAIDECMKPITIAGYGGDS